MVFSANENKSALIFLNCDNVVDGLQYASDFFSKENGFTIMMTSQ